MFKCKYMQIVLSLQSPLCQQLFPDRGPPPVTETLLEGRQKREFTPKVYPNHVPHLEPGETHGN